MKLSHALTQVVAALSLSAIPFTVTAQSMLRVACDGESAGAAITVNGQFKGDCPLDMQVTPGTVRLQGLKSLGQGRERSFETQFAIGSGVAKRVEVELGPVQLNAEGRRLEEDRLRRERATAEAREAEQRRAVAARMAAARAEAEKMVDEVLAAERARPGLRPAGCPNCPRVPSDRASLRAKTDLPDTGDPQISDWARRALNDLAPYLARPETFQPAVEAASPPCDAAMRQMRELAGMPEAADLPASGQDNSKATGHSWYLDLKIWPVKAACQDGRLEGVVDFWMSGVRVLDHPSGINVEPRLVHVMATLAGGKSSGVWTRLVHSRLGLNYLKSESLRNMSSNNPSETDGPARQPGVDAMRAEYRQETTASDSVSVTLGSLYSQNPDVQKFYDGMTLDIVRSLGGGRAESVSWSGTRKASRMLTRDGQLHGELIIYGYSQPTGFLTPDLKFPTTVSCYRNGELVQMKPCRVD